VNRFSITEEAISDLDEIWDYIAEDNPFAANRVIDSIWDVFDLLVDNPRMGRIFQTRNAAIRVFPHNQYLIFYRPEREGILILRILHGRRNIDDLIR